MEQPNQTAGKSAKRRTPEEKIRHLPAQARAAFDAFKSGGDAALLDPLFLAILDEFIPKAPGRPLAAHPGTTRLKEDLGFDSLAMTEVLFFTEDLFDISIGNEEVMEVQTLDDLLQYVRGKVGGRPSA